MNIIIILLSYFITFHECSYEHCPFKEQIIFTEGCGNCEEDSDCWRLDSLHMEYPYEEYDQLEEKLNDLYLYKPL